MCQTVVHRSRGMAFFQVAAHQAGMADTVVAFSGVSSGVLGNEASAAGDFLSGNGCVSR